MDGRLNLNLMTETPNLEASSEDIHGALIRLYPDMSSSIRDDLLPLILGNQRYVKKIRKQIDRLQLLELDHSENIIGVGRGFSWLHLPNRALLIGPYGHEWPDAVNTAVKDTGALDTNNNEDAEFNADITVKDSKEGSQSDEEDEDSDGSEDSDPDAPSYRIQFILARKDMSAKDWIAICGGMYTHEVTRGSVWQQPDEEFFDPSPKPVEKFLIKWIHASYLHLSWETEKDLLEIVGSTAKSAIKKFRLREYYGTDLFEDLSKGEYFLPSCLQVE
eukprot:gene28307-35147_t